MLLAGRVLGLIFEKPSLRTRVSFEAAMAQMGGGSIFLSATDGSLGQREPVPDFARVLSHYCDAVVLRVFRQATVEEFARHSSVPVINGLSDYYHPCQALADLFTVQELFGETLRRPERWSSSATATTWPARWPSAAAHPWRCAFVLAAPDGYRFDDTFVKQFRKRFPKSKLTQTSDPVAGVASADVVYTDVWTSMGQEAEHLERLKQFADFQVNAALLAKAPAHAKLMHCLPAHRGEEVSADAIDGPRSVVFEQAGNRMHSQKGSTEMAVELRSLDETACCKAGTAVAQNDALPRLCQS